MKILPIVNHSLKYNPAIDGLRGIAIILVFVFHLWPEYFPFGYMGVDVFFVLSGFLITKIIYTKLDNNTFTLKEFYRNRIRRIFPTVLIVILVTFLIGYLFMYASELKSLGRHMKTAVLFWQNFRLLEEAGYWDKAAQLKPLLHFWSLSIEEQFYLFWPVLLLILYKLRINFLYAIFIVFSIFLIISQVLDIDKFYHSLARFWELAFGGLIFALTTHFDIKSYLNKFKIPIFSLFIISLISYGNQEFNFLSILFVVCSSGLLLLYLVENPNTKLFASQALVFFGLISFPLYLWHYVIISYAHIFNFDIAQNAIWIIIIAISLSYLTYRYVEFYIRKKTSFKFAMALFWLGVIVVVAFGQRAYLTGGFEYRTHLLNSSKHITQQFEEPIDNVENASLLFEKILGHKNELKTIQLQATSSDPTKQYIVLMGDSHAYSSYDGFSEEFKKKGYETLLLGNPGCKGYPKGSLDYQVIREDCKQGMDQTYEFINKFDNIEKLIFISTNPRHVSSIGYLFEYSSKRDYQFYFLLANPTLDFFPDICATRPFFYEPSKIDCRMDYETYDKQSYEYKKTVFEEVKKYKDIIILDATKLFCDDEYCSPIKDGDVLYKDHHHYSVIGSKIQARYLINNIFTKKIYNEQNLK
ncbi:MAG: acyltransferase [Campylobacteraceae bacterium]|jgi:peptidoglycan/LPS O-acetylase OafA/YrhL|nr:acyltransferase [Campylobacteraceae bacterium]MBT3882943.1 acyltransferase [Campylobacteraceae bacterium]MBT4179284.1 acyltransferase [Campylobacteraceae bacterium]MBT5323916.1 acyltransferase [Campylobacteraceae bacterium]MBT6107754.1 acyltransferase [Campylobacteraceae bacterium]